jgi:cell division protease FtsH
LKQSTKTLLVWIALIFCFVAFYKSMRDENRGSKKISSSEFMNSVLRPESNVGKTNDPTGLDTIDLVDSKSAWQPRVKEIIIEGMSIRGTFKDGTQFHTTAPLSPKQIQMISANGVQVDTEVPAEGSFWLSVLSTWLPILLLLFLVLFFIRQMQAGSGRAMSFGKSRHRMLNDGENSTTFEDVAGVDEAKTELEEIIEFLKSPEKFTKLGGKVPKGVLLMGPPGTGKTLLARAVAGEAGVPFFNISGSEFVEMFVGVGASRVRDLFEQAKKNAPCIIFVDEIDAVGRHRGAGLGGGHDEREQTLNQLLVEMDGFESKGGVIIMAATNRPDVLDPALLRPGRFDRRITVPRPDIRGREKIIDVHTRKTPLGKDVRKDRLAQATPGFSGADLANLVNEAALIAARNEQTELHMNDFDEAKDKVLMGSARKSMFLSKKEKKTTAWHEAGHALVARLIDGPCDPVYKVTIIPRGAALGLTQQVPLEDRHSFSKDYILNRIAVCMGGRIAEEIVFHEQTTGAGNDIVQATDLAHKMVTQWGMSDLGPLSFGSGDEPVFLGMGIQQRKKDYSEQTAIQIDGAVSSIVNGQQERARKILKENRELLDRLSLALLDYETLDTEEIDWVIEGKDLRILHARRQRERESGVSTDENQDDSTTKVSDDEKKDLHGGVPDPNPV